MQSGKQFERLQREAIYKLRSKFHAQTLSNEHARLSEEASLKRPELNRLSRHLIQLRSDHRKDPRGGEGSRRSALRVIESFPRYGVDEDPQFVCSLRILRVAAYFRGPLVDSPPPAVRLALQHLTAHTFLWDPPAAVGFLSILPSLANTVAAQHQHHELDEWFGTNAIGSTALVPDLAATMRVIAPRVYQLAPQFTPTEALTAVAAFGTVDPSIANAEQSGASLLGTVNPAAATGLALEDFAPSPPLDFQPPLIGSDVSLAAAIGGKEGTLPSSASSAGFASGESLPPNTGKTLLQALSTVSLMCTDHSDATEMCRFVYYSAAISPAVGATHLLCLQPKLLKMADTLGVDDIVSLCRCVSRTRRVGRRLMMAVGRRALLLLGDLSTSAIADVLGAFQAANLRHLPLLRRCATRQLMLLEDQSLESAAVTLAALAHFGVNDALVFSALGRRVHRMEMDGTYFASLMHSCATVGIVVPPLLGVAPGGPLGWFADPARLAAEELTSNIAIVLWALSKLIGSHSGDAAGAFPDSTVLVLLRELRTRFAANPAMARSKGASEARALRQTMVIDGCAAMLKVLRAPSAEGSLMASRGADVAAACITEAEALIALLAQ